MPLQTFQAFSEHAGLRLDRFLADRLPHLSRSRIQSLIRSGHVLQDGKPCKPSETVRTGETLTITEPDPIPMESVKPQDIPISILFEDAHLLVLDKPAGMVVHPGAGNIDGTLVSALLHHCGSLSVVGGIERPGIVHRLDKETSGCLVVAKNDTAHRALAAQFAGREVEKVYLAICEGTPRRASGVIDAPIRRHPVYRQKMKVATRDDGREATTAYRILATADGFSLIECRPKTGRTHQIRVHLKHLGHPVAGDPVYGRRGAFTRHLLHAWKISLDHPASGERISFSAPIPSDFQLVPLPPGTKL